MKNKAIKFLLVCLTCMALLTITLLCLMKDGGIDTQIIDYTIRVTVIK